MRVAQVRRQSLRAGSHVRHNQNASCGFPARLQRGDIESATNGGLVAMCARICSNFQPFNVTLSPLLREARVPGQGHRGDQGRVEVA
jgi:hypothetical protein